MKKLGILFGLVACVTPSFASVTLRFDGTALGQSVDYIYNGSGRSSFAGQLKFKDLTNNVNLTTYCVDLDNFISDGQTYDVSKMPTLGDATFARPGSVFANSYASVSNNDKATALQIAIWTARYNGDLSTNTGAFHLKWSWYNGNTSIVNLAKQMLALGDNNPKNSVYYKPDVKDCGQGQLGPVPEPATILAACVGLAGLVSRRRKSS